MLGSFVCKAQGTASPAARVLSVLGGVCGQALVLPPDISDSHSLCRPGLGSSLQS